MSGMQKNPSAAQKIAYLTASGFAVALTPMKRAAQRKKLGFTRRI
jgi:hypothetical protein